jgi:hypothetical protein
MKLVYVVEGAKERGFAQDSLDEKLLVLGFFNISVVESVLEAANWLHTLGLQTLSE